MSEFKVGDKVCFLGGHSLPEFFGGVYEVIGQTIAGIFNDEYVLNDKGKTRRVSYKSIRPATLAESRVGYRIDNPCKCCNGHGEVGNMLESFVCPECNGDRVERNDFGDDFPIGNHISPMC
ncbi:hypothetical protein [Acinetobacter nosocomialis]|uniref:hypothetical protein n=1 Tax=Acinetobacter nosocomialis TaxID=106654 RepID=UPI00196569A4|nr:hypothetical protein [Acinetobacter nosocomialis]MBM9550021.1 hypothetical protein [Acinetobacter nosocomialis]